MKNGLNTGNMSEFVNEIKTNPREAAFRYRCGVDLVTPTVAHAAVQTLGAGSIRVARAFQFDLESNDTVARRHPSPNEYLLTALGGCVIVTFVLGCSARGITLTDLEIALDGKVDAERGGPLEDARYTIRAASTASDRQLRELVEYVSCLSPNHRTFIDKNDFGLEVEQVDATGKVLRSEQITVPLDATVPPRSSNLRDVTARLTWRYGTQQNGEVATSGQRCLLNQVRVDQPKQSLGLDWAANPQEDLLAVLGAEYLHELSALASARGITINRARTELEGTLDLRGLMNVDPSVPVRVHNIRQKLTVESDKPFDALLDLARTAAAASIARQTVCREGAIDVTVHNGTEQIASFRSDREFTSEYLRRLSEAAATKAS